MSAPVSRPRPGVGKRVAVSAVAGVAIAFGGLSAVSWISSSTSTDDPIAIPVQGDNISIEVGSGDVRVSAGDVDEVQVIRTIHSGLTSPELINESDSSGIRLDSECGWNWMGPCSVDYEVVVPADLALTVDTGSGDITVADLTGDVTLTTSSGDVSADNLTGRVELSTSSGDITANDVTGPLTTHATSGDITASGLTADIVNADTSSGDVELTFAEVPTQVNASASSGDVTLLLPDDDTAYRVETEVSSGDEAVGVTEDPDSPNLLSAETSSGDITIRPNGA